MNEELEDQVTAQEVALEETAAEKVIAREFVETMEDFAAELGAPYQTLNKRKIELAEEESSAGAKWAQFQQTTDDRTVVKVKISEAVKGDVVTTPEEVRAFIPVSRLSIEYMEKLEDRQGKYVECTIIAVDPEKKRLVLPGHEMEREKKETEEEARMEQFKVKDVVEGTVDNIKPYGALVKLVSGVDGLLHISQISTQRTEHPGAVLTEGQTIKAKVLSMENGKLSLSMGILPEQIAEYEEHETFDYKGTGSVSIGLGDLLKGLKF